LDMLIDKSKLNVLKINEIHYYDNKSKWKQGFGISFSTGA